MTAKFFPEALFERGFTDLVSVIPPGATLAPSSKISQSQVGKVPGRRSPNGMWGGYDWRRHQPTEEDVKRWCIDGANIGLRADRWPAVDIDCSDERLAAIIEQVALASLGVAPIRIGRAPKRLLMYRTDEPFGRMRLWIHQQTHSDLVEVLGAGQQYLVYGTHPATLKPYAWATDPLSVQIPTITRDRADRFLTELAEYLELLGVGTIEREGSGRLSSTDANDVDQNALRAPSVELVQEAVSWIPNTNELFPSRDDYLKMGYAIRAAVGEDNEPEGLAIFHEWAMRWEGNERFPNGNDPEVVLADWRRMNKNKKIGWGWLCEQARQFGFNDAALAFDVVKEAPDAQEPAPVYGSDQWLADLVVSRHRDVLRFVPQRGQWLVWTGNRYQLDAELRAEDLIKRALRVIADSVARQGATDKEQREALKEAKIISSTAKLSAVMQLVKSDRDIAVNLESLDHDPWLLNTPGGIVNLKTGKLEPASPDALCSKITSVPPDFNGACPEWKRFLAEATGGDRELEAFLQRLCGYSLTGSTREQKLTFIYGPGGNGKSVFLNVLTGILGPGEYAQIAAMDTFTATYGEKHSTDIATLVGARLVTASETQAGKRWDEARVKSLTGGEPVTARFMRQDNFTFLPQFKLLFIGNHKPDIRDADEAMRRRMLLVPFEVKPAVIDPDLGDKLREEWPAILAWMIEGCLEWQRRGLAAPASVLVATDEYMEEQDAVGRWLLEEVELDAESAETTAELFRSWSRWASENGEYVGSLKRLSSALKARGLTKWQEPGTRKRGFRGLRIKDRQFILEA